MASLLDILLTPKFLNAANALNGADDQVPTWRRRAETAKNAVREARNVYNGAARIVDYPRHELEALKRRLARERGARADVVASIATEATRLENRASLRLSDTLARELSPSDGADPVADLLEQQAEQHRLTGMDPAKRAISVRSAAESGESRHRVTLRAALAAPKAGEDPLLPEDVALDARAAILAKRAPDVVRDLHAAQQLRQLSAELGLSDYELALE